MPSYYHGNVIGARVYHIKIKFIYALPARTPTNSFRENSISQNRKYFYGQWIPKCGYGVYITVGFILSTVVCSKLGRCYAPFISSHSWKNIFVGPKIRKWWIIFWWADYLYGKCKINVWITVPIWSFGFGFVSLASGCLFSYYFICLLQVNCWYFWVNELN